MANQSSTFAVFMSILAGIILLIFLDAIFTFTFTGFLATYLTNYEERSTAVGLIASLILGVLFFSYGFIVNPELPSRVSGLVNFDFGGFLVGLVLICLLSMALGALGGYIATKVTRDGPGN
ncbi:MAG: hypothetical protein KKF16_04220 [Euryarchaeota archaeon]|nr:hypothetical protein [Euryarchaeota archaeon]MBV1730009.1 hypothetical protein [Methanobacterium sp.]MBU4548215.1 hypothetical protein [Euryarchaeota archaeon]MBU4608799.1 hypothetical protein [Euryarchaeota archaeon]MBV1754406.1 hypothetical protein [Methanobacterium sp.]